MNVRGHLILVASKWCKAVTAVKGFTIAITQRAILDIHVPSIGVLLVREGAGSHTKAVIRL